MKRARVLVTGAGAPIGEHLVRTLMDDSRVEHILAVTGNPVDTFPIASSGRLTVASVNLSRSRAVHRLLFGSISLRL